MKINTTLLNNAKPPEKPEKPPKYPTLNSQQSFEKNIVSGGLIEKIDTQIKKRFTISEIEKEYTEILLKIEFIKDLDKPVKYKNMILENYHEKLKKIIVVLKNGECPVKNNAVNPNFEKLMMKYNKNLKEFHSEQTNFKANNINVLNLKLRLSIIKMNEVKLEITKYNEVQGKKIRKLKEECEVVAKSYFILFFSRNKE